MKPVETSFIHSFQTIIHLINFAKDLKIISQ